MSLPVPELDDLTFDQLVEEAQGLIPRYAHDWTDHNLHDPGITLLELVAWLVDQQIYQVGFVGNRHIESFATLLGVRPKGAVPAHGLLWPYDGAVSHDVTTTGVDLDEGAHIACIEQPDVPFELAHDVHITPAQLADTAAQDTPERFEITARFRSRQAALPLKETNDTPGTIELVFDRPLVEIGPGGSNHPVAVGIELDVDQQDETAPAAPRGRLVVDYRLERTGAPWRRVQIVEDGTHALNRTGTVLVRIPAEPRVAGTPKTLSRLRLGTRCRVNPIPPRLTRVALNVLPMVQRETRDPGVLHRRSDGLPGSDGLPDQAFELRLQGLTEQEQVPIEVEVEDDGAFKSWKSVEDLHYLDLSQASPHNPVYELDIAGNEIRFGNGVNGRIPPRDAQIRHLEYRLTLGSAGNLAAGLNWTVQGAPLSTSQTAYGRNPAPLTDGADAWSIKDLRREARERALDRRALLTDADLEEAAKGLDGLAVARAHVRAGFHPALPRRKVPGARALIVTPARPADADRLAPVPRRYVAAVERALGPRRVLGERLSVLAAERVPVSVEAQLLVEDGLEAKAVKEKAEARINARLSDVQDPKQRDVKPWPVGRPVTRQEIKTLLAGVDGVIAVRLCRLARGTGKHCHAYLDLAQDAIAIGHDHRITAETLRERED